MIRSEAALAGVALALIGSLRGLTAAERRLAETGTLPSRKTVSATRKAIRAGVDLLGDSFCRLRSPEQRRDAGATYTPAKIVEAMVAWAERSGPDVARIVDPGCGSGRFLMRAAGAFPRASLIGVDVDPLATLLLRANAAVLGFSDRLTIRVADYRDLQLPAIAAPTLFIGNPPYVRHHDIPEKWKCWFAEAARQYGLKASKLAGIHIHFFLRTRQLARPGDLGTFVTAAEWIDVNYGSVLRRLLAHGLGGVALHVIDPKAQPFADAMATGAITCFRVAQRPETFTVRAVDSLDALAPLEGTRAVPWDVMAHAPKWTPLIRPSAPTPSGMIELGELFRVHRGQVTGSNSIWIANVFARLLPERFLLPAITRAHELIDAGPVLFSAAHLKRVIDLPVDLSIVAPSERKLIDGFLDWAKSQGADQSYIARHRRAWWSVGCKPPAPILVTYMGRRPPHFTRNAAGARHLNIAHGLYPRDELPTPALDTVVRLLNGSVTGDGGRVYAGGLIKFEPRELERLLIPRVEISHATPEADQVDSKAAPSRRRQGNGRLPARAVG